MSVYDDALNKLGVSTGKLFDALLAQTPDKVYFKDKDSRFVIVSQSLVDHFGRSSAEDLIGKTDFDFFSDEHARQAYADEQRIIRTGKSIYRKAEKETWPSGKVTWASTSKEPILLNGGKPIGILGISRDVTREKLAQDALERHDAKLKEQNDIMRGDLENARTVQGVLIPGEPPDLPFLRIAFNYEPSHTVSGDVLTFPRPDESGFRFFLGDVCGHGVSAGIYTLLVKYLADRFSRGEEDRVSAVLERMNHSLKDVLPNRFVTAVNGYLAQDHDGTVRFEFSHGAHPDFFLQRKNESASIIKLPASPGIGLIPGTAFPLETYRLYSGDRLFFHTDGFEEARNENGEEFGIDRIRKAMSAGRDVPIRELPDYILQKVKTHMGSTPALDDQSSLAIEIV